MSRALPHTCHHTMHIVYISINIHNTYSLSLYLSFSLCTIWCICFQQISSNWWTIWKRPRYCTSKYISMCAIYFAIFRWLNVGVNNGNELRWMEMYKQKSTRIYKYVHTQHTHSKSSLIRSSPICWICFFFEEKDNEKKTHTHINARTHIHIKI